MFGERPFAIKLADTCITILSAFLFYRLARICVGEAKAKISLLLFFSTLMYSILSLVATPDVPLILFWILSLLMIHRAVSRDRITDWLLAGAAGGLAFDSKYSAVFLPAGLLMFLLICKPYRRFITSYRIPLYSVGFIVFASPVIIWNIRNNFLSFKFQSLDRLGPGSSSIHFSITSFFGVIGHQSGILLPILFVSLLVALFSLFKKNGTGIQNTTPTNLFLLSFLLPAFVGFLILSPFYWIKVNWIMPAYISGIILAAGAISKKWLKWQVILSFFVHLIFAVEVLFYIVPIRSEDTWFGWDKLAAEVKILRDQNPSCFIFSAKSYKTASILDLYLQEPVYGPNIIGEPGLQFGLVYRDLSKLAGKDALFVICEPGFHSLEKATTDQGNIKRYFEDVTQLHPIIIKNRDKAVRKFLVYFCRNYRPPAVDTGR